MSEKEKCIKLDLILFHLTHKRSIATEELFRILGTSEAFISYLCEELKDEGYVTLTDTSVSKSDAIKTYIVLITNKGKSFFSLNHGYTRKYKNQLKKDRWNNVKSAALVVNTVFLTIISVLTLQSQKENDTQDRLIQKLEDANQKLILKNDSLKIISSEIDSSKKSLKQFRRQIKM